MDKIKQLRDLILKSENALLRISLVRKALSLILTRNFIRYLIIGFTTFGMQIGLLYLFTQLLGLEKVMGNVFSTLLSVVFNFIMSNYWTFKAGSGAKKKKLGRYLVLFTFNYLFDTALAFPLLVNSFNVNQYIAKIVITGMIVAWNFFLYKLWVFKD
ncbi:MAG TPA: GtrA family protein [Candidatus Dojkabacteria bacterium]|nr:GtrA family protein [Candidatus Dojkabacteria bacterium]